jgi:hypothetical protein
MQTAFFNNDRVLACIATNWQPHKGGPVSAARDDRHSTLSTRPRLEWKKPTQLSSDLYNRSQANYTWCQMSLAVDKRDRHAIRAREDSDTLRIATIELLHEFADNVSGFSPRKVREFDKASRLPRKPTAVLHRRGLLQEHDGVACAHTITCRH